MTLCRPPRGKVTAHDLVRLWRGGLTTVLWNVDPKDYAKHTANEVRDWFGDRPFQGGDVVSHDNHPHVVEVLPELIAAARSHGLDFTTVEAWTDEGHLAARMTHHGDGRRKRNPYSSRISFRRPAERAFKRVTKFVKYLPQHGWDVSVLTVANPSVPLHDASLAKDIPADTLIRRTRSWEPGYALKATVATNGDGRVPKRQGLATRFVTGSAGGPRSYSFSPRANPLDARRGRGRQATVSQVPHDVVLASAPPFTNFLVGQSLSRSARCRSFSTTATSGRSVMRTWRTSSSIRSRA